MQRQFWGIAISIVALCLMSFVVGCADAVPDNPDDVSENEAENQTTDGIDGIDTGWNTTIDFTGDGDKDYDIPDGDYDIPDGDFDGNPDGDGTSENPDGDGTSENPDGDGTSENPDGDGTSENPDGDGTSENPDGDGTSENPDGDGDSSGDKDYEDPDPCPDDGVDEGDWLDAPLTQGYWKNHPDAWPYGVDSCYASICDTTFQEILWTPAADGDAWIILGYQWIAAVLNVDSGVEVCGIEELLEEGQELLLSCQIDEESRDRAIEIAAVLDAFNNGEDVDLCDIY